MSIQEMLNWLNEHPKIKSALVVAESAAAATMLTYVNSLMTGNAVFSKTGLETFGATLLTAVYLAVKNYFTAQAVSVKK